MDGTIVISIAALAVSLPTALWQIILTHRQNAVPMLIELFKEHRDPYLADARKAIQAETFDAIDLSTGLVDGLPEHLRDQIRDLMWFYDNLGVLVIHRIVDIRPVSGYLGASAERVRELIEPLVHAERERRREAGWADADRWQHYFEMLVETIQRSDESREGARRGRLWRIRAWLGHAPTK